MEFSLQKVILKIFVTCFLASPQLFWYTGHTTNAEIKHNFLLKLQYISLYSK